MFDARDIQLWIHDEQLNIRVPVAFEINDAGELVVASSEDIARIAQYRVNEERGTVEVEYLIGHGRSFDIHIERWIPKFILADKNGYAMAKAIEAGLMAMNDIVQDGVANLMNVQLMPEWALDEKAWEYNIPYDYSAPIETKRGWIANAFKLNLLAGTPEGVVKYLESYFDAARIEEWWEYDGEPYHFQVETASERTDENYAWAQKAIEQVKNARSVLDVILYNSTESHAEGVMGGGVFGTEIVIHVETIER